MEDGVPCGSRTFRSGSSLCDVLLQEYHSRPEAYKDVRIRFEDGSVLETSRLLLGCLSEVLFDSLSGIPPWEDAEILLPGLESLSTKSFLDCVLSCRSEEEERPLDEGEEDVMRALGFDLPPRLEKRLRAYYCEDCDVHCPRDGILSHVRDAHPLSRKALSSPIWSFFEATEHPDFHLCRECKSVFKDKSPNTSGLIRHLEVQHPDSYEEFLIQGGGNERRLLPQAPLDSCSKRRSVIWKYFSESLSESGISSCNACGRGFKYRGQTSSMIRHLKFKHADIYGDYAQSTLMASGGGLGGKFELMESGVDFSESDALGGAMEEELVAVSTNMPEAGEALLQESSKFLKRSPLNAYFEKQGSSSHEFDCKSCSSSFNLDLQSSSELIKHLKTKHPHLYQELIDGFLDEDFQDDEDLLLPDDEDDDDEDDDEEEEDDEDEEWRIEDAGNEMESEEEGEDSQLMGSNCTKKSIAWQYFESTEMADVNACKLCSRVLKCKKQNTSTMVRHLRRAHPEVFLDVDQRGIRPLEVELTSEELADEYNEEYEYFVDFFIPMEDDIALSECKICAKVFREENIQGQMTHMKSEHTGIYDGIINSSRKQMDHLFPGPSSSGTVGGNKVKKRSLIWNYFDQTSTPGINSCMLCLKTFKCKGQTTSSMIRHLKSDHPKVYEEFSSLTASIYGRKIGESFQKFAPLTNIKTEPDFPTASAAAAPPLMDTEEENEVGGGDESLKMNKLFKRRSSIWNYFDPTDVPETNACKLCKKEFKCKGRTTSSMIRHLKKVHIEAFKEFLRFRNVPHDFLNSIKLEEKSSSSKVGGSSNSDLILQYFTRPPKAPEWRECKECMKRITKIPGKKGLSILVRHLEESHAQDYEAYLSQGGAPVGEDNTKVCSECGEKFPNRGSLTQHMKSVHAASCPYKCLECNASFTRRESYEQHSHDKNKPRNFLCTICGKTFARRSIRNFHEKAHKGDKKYQCAYCPKKFLTNQRKYKHERTHTGEKPYQCTECGRQFTQSHHLVTHARIHTGQKPYTCNFCPQTFRHLSSRNNHKCEGKLRSGGGPGGGSSAPGVGVNPL